jgi:dephospho-CoA kinase
MSATSLRCVWIALDERLMEHGKPVIGLTGGIGSGKSFVADLFREEGCCVISSDALVREAYKDERLKHTLKHWWGQMVFDPRGDIDRSAVARKIFSNESDRRRLEQVLHPLVDQARARIMRQAGEDPAVKAFVWDTPLLFETGIDKRCDAVVFVDAPLPLRVQRVQTSRGWDESELLRRENLQMPLDSKREKSDDVITNATDAGSTRVQVREVLSRIIARTQQQPQAT